MGNMLCVKCGKPLPPSAQFCPNCGEKAPEKPPSPRFSSTLTIFIISLLGLIFLSYLRNVPSIFVIENERLINLGIFGFALIIVVLLLTKIFAFLKKIFRQGFKKPILLIPGGLIVLLILGGIYYGIVWFSSSSYYDIEDSLSNLQDIILETAVGKSIGDTIQSGNRNVPSGWSMNKISETAQTRAEWLNNLSVNSRLIDYKKVLIQWTSEIREAAKNPKNWEDLAERPADFSLTMNSRKANQLFAESVKKISELKQFGDLAVKNKDRQAMRYIAAKLLIQKHWLDGIAYSEDPGFLDFSFIPLAYAYTGNPRKICYRDYRGVGTCYEEVVQWTTEMYNAAEAYSQGETTAEQQWTELGQKLEGTPVGGAGITEGEKEEMKYSPKVQQFIDDCHGLAGIVDGTGTVKTRMPTTESGYTCEYKQEGNTCWKMLTYSGGYYAGGNPGCPEANLLPKIVVEPTKPKEKDETTTPIQEEEKTPVTYCDFNGNYSISGTITCQGTYVSPISKSYSGTLGVRNNSVQDVDGTWRKIDSNGNVTISTNIPVAFGGAATRMTYYFYCSGGKVFVKGSSSGSGSVSVEGVTIQVRCSGSESGSKISR